MPNATVLAKKNKYFAKLIDLIETHPKMLIVHADFVGSKQMQDIRTALRGKATLLMGKNTMVRTALRQYMAGTPTVNVERLLASVRGNIGFLFCKAPMDEVREIVGGFVKPASAKAGVVAPVSVSLKQGGTGLDPSQTSFFQALNIATKIVKGSIELVTDIVVVQEGTKVTASQQVLLTKLGIKPFEYSLKMLSVFDSGAVFDIAVLDITDDAVVSKFMAGLGNVAAFSREAGIPTEASMPHAIANAFKNIVALCSDIDFTFPEIQELKDFLSDPEAMAKALAAAAAASAGPATGGGAAAAAAAPVEEEEEEEEEEGMDFDLFG